MLCYIQIAMLKWLLKWLFFFFFFFFFSNISFPALIFIFNFIFVFFSGEKGCTHGIIGVHSSKEVYVLTL
jgi:hypothetical protein